MDDIKCDYYFNPVVCEFQAESLTQGSGLPSHSGHVSEKDRRRYRRNR
jgi:hypothetical protein